jgi:transposase
MALRPPGARWPVANDEPSSTALVTQLQAVHPTLMVREATGGSQRAVVAALAVAGLPVVVAHPRHTREFAQATGQWATTDARDARARAHCADAVRPTPRPLPAAETADLQALVTRRRQCVARRTAARHRLSNAPGRLRVALEAPIAWRDQRLVPRDDDRDTTRRARPIWRERAALYRPVPGSGPGWTRTRRLALPEWGTLSRQRLAALVGGAPFHRDSGTLRGHRTIWGGRAQVRATLSMGTLVAVRHHALLNACYARLLAAGKAKKGALTACMRKLLTLLNAMGKHKTPWQPREVAIA